ncbi:MAG TPA: ribosome recycling factor [Clostridiales bacterium UBA8153]|nr:ribosome recycling factor [Clostridiales bacterium UBA8153]
MVKDIMVEAESRMEKVIEGFRRELAGLRAGRATPALLDKIRVEYHGVPTPINQLASIGVPEPRQLVVQPWDKGAIPSIEKAILKSELGITPLTEGSLIRLTVPQLTHERRQDLVKVVRKKAEEEKVAIRNIRRDAMVALKDMQKAGKISEDDGRRATDDAQKLTDRFIKQVDTATAAKEKEIMEV